MRIFYVTLLVAVLFFAFFPAGCAGPVDENAPDYAEFESVWQYLKAYSIYQDRITDDPFSFPTTEDLLESVADTLKGNNYTCYYGFSGVSTRTAVYGAAPGTKEVVTLDTLTDSTVRISISSFDYGVTFNQFMELLPLVAHFPNLIIDLRFNGGGEIEEATAIVDAFLPVNTSYILAREREYLTEERSARTIEWHPWKTTEIARIELRDKRVVVLMDTNSASASEIVVAALKDGAGATLVGATTYGKGIGQIRLQRRDRPILQITFLQLKGLDDGSIGDYHRTGINPDIPASGSDEAWLLTAVRVHEPGVTSLRPLRKRVLPAVAYEPAGYLMVYEE